MLKRLATCTVLTVHQEEDMQELNFLQESHSQKRAEANQRQL